MGARAFPPAALSAPQPSPGAVAWLRQPAAYDRLVAATMRADEGGFGVEGLAGYAGGAEDRWMVPCERQPKAPEWPLRTSRAGERVELAPRLSPWGRVPLPPRALAPGRFAFSAHVVARERL